MNHISRLCTLFFGILLMSSCVVQSKYDKVVGERDEFKEKADMLDSLQKVVAALEEDNLSTNAMAGSLLRDIEQLTVTNKSLYASYQDLVATLSEYEGIQSGDPNNNLSNSLNAHREALRQKEIQLKQLEQQAQALSRGQGGSFGAPSNQFCNILQQEGAGMMAQLQQLHFTISQAMAANTNPRANSKLSDATTSVTVSVDVSWMMVPGRAQLSEEGRAALARFADVLRPFNQLNLFIEAYPSTDLVNGWEQSGVTSAIIAKELALNGAPEELLFPVGKDYPGRNSFSTDKAGRILFVFKPQYERLHNMAYNPGNSRYNNGGR